MRALDSTGRAGVASTRVVVGNTPPVITFLAPAPDLPFEFGDVVDYEVSISDDTPVDCARVSVDEVLVHNDHPHVLSTAQGCTGSFATLLDDGHAGAENLFIALRATYTDAPTAPGAPPLSGVAFALLFPPDFEFPEEPQEPQEPETPGDPETPAAAP